MTYVEPVFKFKTCDMVQLKSITGTPALLVTGNASSDDLGYVGSYARVFWIDAGGRPHTATLPEAALELVQS